jgi:ketosteroid isomerase-like protein
MSTITEHPNAAAVRRMYEAVNEKDMGALAALISPDVVFVMPGTSPLAGLYNGRDALFGFFGRMAEVTAGTYHAELRVLYASDDSVVAVHHGTGMRRAKELDANAALLFNVSDGVVTAITVHQQRQNDWDEFFG